MNCKPATLVALTLATGALCGCAADGPAVSNASFAPKYSGIETILLDNDLVDFRVQMSGARDDKDVDAYAACAAAQYALIRGFGFARHLRTNVEKQGGVWRGDAVYTISASLPRGMKTLDAEVTVRDCGAQGIPTV
jgi:hypothetical protein